jgi:hypothetical protein
MLVLLDLLFSWHVLLGEEASQSFSNEKWQCKARTEV